DLLALALAASHLVLAGAGRVVPATLAPAPLRALALPATGAPGLPFAAGLPVAMHPRPAAVPRPAALDPHVPRRGAELDEDVRLDRDRALLGVGGEASARLHLAALRLPPLALAPRSLGALALAPGALLDVHGRRAVVRDPAPRDPARPPAAPLPRAAREDLP